MAAPNEPYTEPERILGAILDEIVADDTEDDSGYSDLEMPQHVARRIIAELLKQGWQLHEVRPIQEHCRRETAIAILNEGGLTNLERVGMALGHAGWGLQDLYLVSTLHDEIRLGP